jgi:hypothetical protein
MSELSNSLIGSQLVLLTNIFVLHDYKYLYLHLFSIDLMNNTYINSKTNF